MAPQRSASHNLVCHAIGFLLVDVGRLADAQSTGHGGRFARTVETTGAFLANAA